jgi:hypothetical protein
VLLLLSLLLSLLLLFTLTLILTLILGTFFSACQIILILQWNQYLGIPNFYFALGDTAITALIFAIQVRIRVRVRVRVMVGNSDLHPNDIMNDIDYSPNHSNVNDNDINPNSNLNPNSNTVHAFLYYVLYVMSRGE